ncbi:hypothetical protein BX600DRAFT_428794 [Xylariales sp. PMI_506]|nr:hypothetical protein BX600DRAFT_428794 [Xylariales sp. PMI_506]
MSYSIILRLAVLNILHAVVYGQVVSYIVSTVTECRPITSPILTSSPPQSTQCPGTVTYSMPPCLECGCPTCTATSVYTTNIPIFCSTGLTQQPYTITETYVGMTSLPQFSPMTSVPYGFTTGVETCTGCGPTKIVMTMTYPSGSQPYAATSACGVIGTPTSQSAGPPANPTSTCDDETTLHTFQTMTKTQTTTAAHQSEEDCETTATNATPQSSHNNPPTTSAPNTSSSSTVSKNSATAAPPPNVFFAALLVGLSLAIIQGIGLLD